MVKKVAILTAGGFAPCLSSAIGGLVQRYTEVAPEVEIIAYKHGYQGLLQGDYFVVDEAVRAKAHLLHTFGGSPIGNSRVKLTLTHSLRSPITEHADFVLVNGNKQGKLQGDSIGTKIAQLFVLDLIYALLVQAEQERAVKTKQKTLDVILEQRIK